jgi:hypothetical protein
MKMLQTAGTDTTRYGGRSDACELSDAILNGDNKMLA